MTTSFNAVNERLKQQYFRFLREAYQKSEATVRAAEYRIRCFEEATEWAGFSTFNSNQAIAFKRKLSARGVAKATERSTLMEVKRFFIWLCGQPGFKSKIRRSDIEFLNQSANDARTALAVRPRDYPTLEQALRAFALMPSDSETDRRDRALFALLLMTGMRDAAAISLRLKHVDLVRLRVNQDPREVRTKFRKQIVTTLFSMGDDVEAAFTDWVRHLREERLFGNDDPVFPRTAVTPGKELSFSASGVEPVFWETTSPARAVFKAAFERAGLPYYPPHTMRHLITHLVAALPLTPEQLKALSQNLGHANPMVTVTSYGHVAPERQDAIIREFRLNEPPGNRTSKAGSDAMLKQIRDMLNELPN